MWTSSETSSGTSSLGTLDNACKKFGIDKSWIGDCDAHIWVINEGAEASMLCDNYIINEYDEGKNGISFYGLYPKMINEEVMYARWQWSEKKGLLLHKETCDGNGICDCMDVRSLMDLIKGLASTDIVKDAVKNVIDSIAVTTETQSLEISNGADYSAEFDELIKNEDFEKGCKEMGFEKAWIRDGKEHTWTITFDDDGKSVKQTFNKWTIDVDMGDDNGKEELYFYGEFVFTEDNIKTPADEQIYKGLVLGQKYEWEWTAKDGLCFIYDQ